MSRRALLIGLGLLATACWAAAPSGAADPAVVRVLDETQTTFGWTLQTDKNASRDLQVVEGPGAGVKAVELAYEFKESNWIAVSKEMAFTLGNDDGIRFKVLGSGATVNLQIKVFDANGNAGGCTAAGGTVSPEWREEILPRAAFEFLWGPSPNKTLNWNSLTKFEFTLDTAERGGMSYVINKVPPGKIAFSTLEIVNTTLAKPAGQTAPSPPVLEKARGKRMKNGLFLIDDLTSTAGWHSASDQDGKCDLSITKEKIGKSTVRALRAQYTYGAKGAWTAVIKNLNLDLSKMKTVGFYCRCDGEPGRLVFKLSDGNKRVYGAPVPCATVGDRWQRIAINRDDLKFLYSDGEPGKLDFSDIQKLEWTLEKSDDKTTAGALLINGLTYK